MFEELQQQFQFEGQQVLGAVMLVLGVLFLIWLIWSRWNRPPTYAGLLAYVRRNKIRCRLNNHGEHEIIDSDRVIIASMKKGDSWKTIYIHHKNAKLELSQFNTLLRYEWNEVALPLSGAPEDATELVELFKPDPVPRA